MKGTDRQATDSHIRYMSPPNSIRVFESLWFKISTSICSYDLKAVFVPLFWKFWITLLCPLKEVNYELRVATTNGVKHPTFNSSVQSMDGMLSLLIFCSVAIFFTGTSLIGGNISDRSFEILGTMPPGMAKLWPFLLFRVQYGGIFILLMHLLWDFWLSWSECLWA